MIAGLLAVSTASYAAETSIEAPKQDHSLKHLIHGDRGDGLPNHWDKRIPLPPGAAVTDVKPPVGAAQTVEISSPLDYDKTVAFYREGLPKAGFQLGPELKVPARKVYNLNFTRASVQDTLTVFPDKADPSKMKMRIVYTPEKGWIRTRIATWEDRARVLPKWWRHREEEKREQKEAKESNAGDKPDSSAKSEAEGARTSP
jgi:hypothetical protein